MISVFMGSMEVPSQSSDIIKVPTAHYEFGANFLDPKVGILVLCFWNNTNLRYTCNSHG